MFARSPFMLIVLILFATAGLEASDRGGGVNLDRAETHLLSFDLDPASGKLTTHLQVDKETWTIELIKVSLRADGFRVLVDDGSGSLATVPNPPIRTWRGRILEIPGSIVRATYEGGVLRGMIYTSDAWWALQPLSDFSSPAQPGQNFEFWGCILNLHFAINTAVPAQVSIPL